MTEPSATPATRAAIESFARTLPMHDRQDFEDARRGFVAQSVERQVRAADGRVVWDLDAYEFMRGADVPDTANPSLWRQGQLLIEDGLFEVVPGIYQLRGFDRSVAEAPAGATRFSLSRRALIGVVTGQLDLAEAVADGTVVIDGDTSAMANLVGLLAPVDPGFDIVTP